MRPDASITREAFEGSMLEPISVISPSSTAMSITPSRFWEGSRSRPLVIRRSVMVPLSCWIQRYEHAVCDKFGFCHDFERVAASCAEYCAVNRRIAIDEVARVHRLLAFGLNT